MMTSLPVEGVRIRYFWRVLIRRPCYQRPRHRQSGVGSRPDTPRFRRIIRQIGRSHRGAGRGGRDGAWSQGARLECRPQKMVRVLASMPRVLAAPARRIPSVCRALPSVPRVLALFTGAGLLVAVGGCDVKHPTSDLVKGKQLFVQKCGSCHTLSHAASTGTVGPNLDDAFRQDKADGVKATSIQGL